MWGRNANLVNQFAGYPVSRLKYRRQDKENSIEYIVYSEEKTKKEIDAR